ncbi:MAG: putative glycoside hydrolase [Planctomycetota bacterium]
MARTYLKVLTAAAIAWAAESPPDFGQGLLLAAEPAGALAARVGGRSYPSVFQAWSSADPLPGADKLDMLVRHDLVFGSPGLFGLRWQGRYTGLATGFDPQSVEQARAFRKYLLERNPQMVLLLELRYRDAGRDYLPEGHPWWMRDEEGELVLGWEEGNLFKLDFDRPDFRAQVATQAKAVMATGAVDGVMLDWWSDDDGRMELVRAVREAVGPDALILANANDRTTPKTAEYINGYFMECYRSKSPADWKRIAETLTWAEQNLREPRINCLETWYHQSRDDLHLMRATTTLGLTHSDGYCLFSDPNELPTPDHRHNWYAFWDKSLGRPLGPNTTRPDGATVREFERGLAVYNPPGNEAVRLQFDSPHTSRATGRTAREHEVPAGDGDLLIHSR